MSNKGKEAARLKPDARREQILRVATDHFTHENNDAVSIQKIAADAGVTRALVYHYFPGKDSLLEAVFQAEAEALLAATAPDPALSARENVERSVGAYLDHFAASSGKLREFYAPRGATAPLVQELVARNHHAQVERILPLLGSDTPLARLAIGAWLAFAAEAARLSVSTARVSKTEVIGLCIDAMQAVLGDMANNNADRTRVNRGPRGDRKSRRPSRKAGR